MSAVPQSLRHALADRYELEEMIGRGGMATVYRAHDAKHGRRVAVKVLRSDLGEAIGPVRFLREIEIAARLTHPNILPLYDSGEAQGQLYYVMPFIDGESLRGLLSRVRLMDTDGAVDITRRVADALDYAHRQGIVHRDIKPENILLPGGQPVVADFGIAKAASGAASDAGLTRTGYALGTPGYMSPEQAAGLLDLGPTTDVYSLGVVTYEMLVGAVPRAWVTPDYLGAGRLLDAPPEHRTHLDRLPSGMERALLRALALRPEERFPSAGEFATALESPESLTGPVPAAPVRDPGDEALQPPRHDDGASDTRLPMTRRRTVTTDPPPSGGFLGAPSSLVAERVLEFEALPEDCEDLVEEARATFRAVGHTAHTERSVIWTARKPRETGQGFDLESLFDDEDEIADVVLRIGMRRGKTHIRLEQRLGGAAAGIFGGVMGGGGTGGLGVLLGVGLGALGLPAAPVVVVAAGWLGGTYYLSRGIFRTVVRNRQLRLEHLADRMAELCEEAGE